ncbi:MAG: DNA repair protein RecO [Chloroflexi bacterium]|nr:DNA repair protein RecO [Chloroflexota bacterium]
MKRAASAGEIMRSERVYRTEAVVLRRADFGEADRLLTLFTVDRGKIRVLAKGARRAKSRLGGNVELYVHSSMLIAQGRNLDIVTQSETIHSFIGLRESLLQIAQASYVAELMDALTAERAPDYPLFDLLLRTFAALAETSDAELVSRSYELLLLDRLGYRPELRRCVHCRESLTPGRIFFSAPLGGTLCPTCGETRAPGMSISVDAVKALRLLLERESVLPPAVKIGAGVRREAEHALRRYVTYVLEREPRSGQFLDSLRHELLQVTGDR